MATQQGPDYLGVPASVNKDVAPGAIRPDVEAPPPRQPRGRGSWQHISEPAARVIRGLHQFDSPRERAIKRVGAEWGAHLSNPDDRQFVGACVDLVLEELAEADRDMVEAGREEIGHALPPGTSKSYQRQLCRVIWRAMLARVP
jgi:hypothetical protein